MVQRLVKLRGLEVKILSGGVFNPTTWMLYVEAHSTVNNEEGLEFKGVFVSIAPDFFSRNGFYAKLARVGL